MPKLIEMKVSHDVFRGPNGSLPGGLHEAADFITRESLGDKTITVVTEFDDLQGWYVSVFYR